MATLEEKYSEYLQTEDVHKIPFLEAFQDLTDVISVTYGTTSADAYRAYIVNYQQ